MSPRRRCTEAPGAIGVGVFGVGVTGLGLAARVSA
jgi:hypothetical protein